MDYFVNKVGVVRGEDEIPDWNEPLVFKHHLR